MWSRCVAHLLETRLLRTPRRRLPALRLPPPRLVRLPALWRLLLWRLLLRLLLLELLERRSGAFEHLHKLLVLDLQLLVRLVPRLLQLQSLLGLVRIVQLIRVVMLVAAVALTAASSSVAQPRLGPHITRSRWHQPSHWATTRHRPLDHGGCRTLRAAAVSLTVASRCCRDRRRRRKTHTRRWRPENRLTAEVGPVANSWLVQPLVL